MNCVLFLILVIIEFVTSYNTTLKLVHVCFRHGSRIPDEHEVYPNDPHYEILKGRGFGQLTKEGKLRSYELGKILRNKYKDFLGHDFQSDMVFTKSTDTERTKMTALLVLAGLFPPSSNDKWNEDLNWIPIPYTYTNLDEDYVLLQPINYCPVYEREFKKVIESEEVMALKEEYKETFELIYHHTGKKHTSLRQIFLLSQLLNTKLTMNFTLPAWAAKIYPDVRHLAIMQCFYENSNNILKRLNGGRALSKIMENIQQKIENTLQPSGRKIFLYSGHDNNIVNILATLNIYQLHFPNFNAAVCIELHQEGTSQRYFIKVFYIKDVFSEPEEQFLKDCGTPCYLENFAKVISPYLPLNYTQECDSHKCLD